MAESPTPEMIERMHRYFAVECNNGCWALMDQASRTADEEREMLNLAYSAAYHWSKVGTPLNDARADLAIAQAHCLLRQPDLALAAARRALDYFQNNPGEDWDLAFAHSGLAYAAAVAGDAPLHRRHYNEARRLGDRIQDEQDRQIFQEIFAKTPDQILK